MLAHIFRRVTTALVASVTLASLTVVLAPAAAGNPSGTGLVISEAYVNGGSAGASFTNKFVELYNPTAAAIALPGDSLQYRAATSTVTPSGSQVFALSGSVPAHQHFLIQLPSNGANGGALPTPDLTSTGVNPAAAGGTLYVAAGLTGVLPTDPAVIDKIGWGTSNSPEGTAATGNSVALSYQRDPNGTDTDNNAADFVTAAPTPTNAAGQTAGGGGGNPPATVTIAQIQGTDTDTSPYAGQSVITTGIVIADYPTGGFNGFFLETGGAGGTAAQDATPGASDAIFVFTSSAPTVSLGDSVQVTGTVSEFKGETEIGSPTVVELPTGLPAVVPDAIPWSQLATDAQKEAHEGELIAPQGDFTVTDNYNTNFYGEIELAAGDQTLQQPTDVGTPGGQAAKDAVAYNSTHAVFLDDGSSWTLGPTSHADDPLPWLTGSPVSIGSKVTFHQPVVLDYRNGQWNFQPRSQVTGDGSAVATFSDQRSGNALPGAVGGGVRLATFNVENFFPTTGDGFVADNPGATCSYYTDRDGNRITVNTCTFANGDPGPRGAATAASYQRQLAKIVYGINHLGAGIVSLEEIENGAKFGQDRDWALAQLVDALNADAGAGTWAYVGSPAADALPPLAEQDVIRTAFIYRPAVVSPVRGSAVLTGDSGAGQAFSIAREPLAQAFKKVGAPDSDAFLVVANHLKSKGADADGLFDDCPSGGDAENTDPASDQGGFNCTRLHEVTDMWAWAQQQAAAVGTNRIFLVGDFNAYTHEDPISYLTSQGLTDIGSAEDPTHSSYSYDGLEGSLDHVLANPAALAMVTGASIWQINAQESVADAYSRYNYNITNLFDPQSPWAASDHDPEVVGLVLPSPAAWSPGTVYGTGDVVYYRGSTWRALWYSKGTAPGDPNGAFEEIVTSVDGTAIWTPSRVFNTGDLVEYQGSTWKALWYSRNQQPGDVSGPWQEIRTAPDGTAIWTPTRVFNAGDVVLYQPTGKMCTARWYTRNQAPGDVNGPWRLLG